MLTGLLLFSLPGYSQGKKTTAPVMLKAGKVITQSMKTGDSHEYQVQLKAGEALKATVAQKGVDVLVTAYGPDGTKLGSFDSPTNVDYMEFVTVVAPQTGRYRLVMTPFNPKGTPGNYEVKLERIMNAAAYAQSQAEDRKRADAVAAYLQTPHPGQSYDEQRAEMLKLDPAALMPTATVPEVEAARWLEGTWTAATKRYATPGSSEVTLPPSTRVVRFDPKQPAMLTTLTVTEAEKGTFQPLMAFEPHSRQWVQVSMEADEAGISWEMLKGRDWANNQLVMEGESAFMGMATHYRHTWAKTDENNVRRLVEERKADGSWLPVAETQFVKQSPTTISAK
ncbi:hypothetical protein GCM10022408_16000 [Hymenobacter fastidiosus]|uniref:DUF4198 domain-containing protein n=1 Tax=Hymenobacter fastidiosus TaxID=486264 RepID=A0ABP7S111_9BACT